MRAYNFHVQKNDFEHSEMLRHDRAGDRSNEDDLNTWALIRLEFDAFNFKLRVMILSITLWCSFRACKRLGHQESLKNNDGLKMSLPKFLLLKLPWEENFNKHLDHSNPMISYFWVEDLVKMSCFMIHLFLVFDLWKDLRKAQAFRRSSWICCKNDLWTLRRILEQGIVVLFFLTNRKSYCLKPRNYY